MNYILHLIKVSLLINAYFVILINKVQDVLILCVVVKSHLNRMISCIVIPNMYMAFR